MVGKKERGGRIAGASCWVGERGWAGTCCTSGDINQEQGWFNSRKEGKRRSGRDAGGWVDVVAGTWGNSFVWFLFSRRCSKQPESQDGGGGTGNLKRGRHQVAVLEAGGLHDQGSRVSCWAVCRLLSG